VICQTQDGSTVSDGYCTTTKPATSQACNAQACPPQFTYGWQLVPGQCTETCGGGLERFVCKRNDDTSVADSYCTEPKPQVVCNTHACSVQYTYSWFTGAWSVCSKSCGSGVRTRDVLCRRNDGMNMADIYCQGQSQPASTEVCNTQSCPVTGRAVTTTMTLPQAAVDVMLIVDDSASMQPENQKLAQRMSGFLTDLDNANVDYRICITTTDVRQPSPPSPPDAYGHYGRPLNWGTYSGNTFTQGGTVISRTTPNKAQLFNDTIRWVGHGWSNDEQGIKAAHLMLDNYPNAGCFRNRSTLAAIIISDEDERSVGGRQSWSAAQYQPLTPQNYPDSLIARVAAKYNTSTYVKPFIWNSIIVKGGDTTCEAIQDAQGNPSFFGLLYQELSNKTGGHVGSICSNDYTQDLVYIKNRVVQTMPYVTLECVPTNTPTYVISPNRATNISLNGNQVSFNPALPEGTSVSVSYRCP
jgi:hypothetical protein